MIELSAAYYIESSLEDYIWITALIWINVVSLNVMKYSIISDKHISLYDI